MPNTQNLSESAGYFATVNVKCKSVGENPDVPGTNQLFLDNLVRLRILSRKSANQFLKKNIGQSHLLSQAQITGEALVRDGLLTAYQLDRIMAGMTHGLVLGNHRILDRLGSGAMGVVYRAEHMFLKRQAAIKVLPVDDDCSPELLERFHTEMRVLAELHHPNIVMAYDAGSCPSPAPGLPSLLYLAMELIDGWNLEAYVQEKGVPSISQACRWIADAACGLQQAHDHRIIHRDIKPSNMLLPKTGQVKLGDFGLVRQFCSKLTDPNTLLGTLAFMPPEQSADPSSVGTFADIYGLGASLFWLLTKELPFPLGTSVRESLQFMRTGRPRRLKIFRPEVPPDLDAFVDKLLDPDPTRRPALPMTVTKSLARFIESGTANLISPRG